jgi:hypothetical protein
LKRDSSHVHSPKSLTPSLTARILYFDTADVKSMNPTLYIFTTPKPQMRSLAFCVIGAEHAVETRERVRVS